MKASSLFLSFTGLAAAIPGYNSGSAPRSTSYDLVGFAKDNPFGTTTGGNGENVKTVSTPEALLAAVSVRSSSSLESTGH